MTEMSWMCVVSLLCMGDELLLVVTNYKGGFCRHSNDGCDIKLSLY